MGDGGGEDPHSITWGQHCLCRGGSLSPVSRGSAGRGGTVLAQLQTLSNCSSSVGPILSNLNAAPDPSVQPPCIALQGLFAF